MIFNGKRNMCESACTQHTHTTHTHTHGVIPGHAGSWSVICPDLAPGQWEGISGQLLSEQWPQCSSSPDLSHAHSQYTENTHHTMGGLHPLHRVHGPPRHCPCILLLSALSLPLSFTLSLSLSLFLCPPLLVSLSPSFILSNFKPQNLSTVSTVSPFNFI